MSTLTNTTQKTVKTIKQTFAHIYNKTAGTKEPLSRYRRTQSIVEEMQRYKPNMDLKSTRPRRLHVAIMIVVLGMGIFLTWRIWQWVFVTDFWLGVYGMLVGFVIVLSFICSYFFYRNPYHEAMKNPKVLTEHPPVSVVIATKNERPITLHDCVYSCLNSSYPNLEVVVINDGSDDGGKTANAIDELRQANPNTVKTVHLTKNLGKRKAMMTGVYRAKGDIVVFLDSDTIVEKDGIARLVACMIDDPDLGAIVGYCRALNADHNALTKMQDTWYHSAFTVGKGMEHSLGRSVSCCSGILSAYRMEAIKPCIYEWANDHFLGIDFMAGDDRQLTAYVIGGNKYKIDKNLKQWKAGYCESAISISEVPTTIKKFVKQQIRWEQSWTRVFVFTAPWYYKGRHPLAAIDYYLRMALSYFAPVIAVLNLVVAPLTGHWESTAVYILGLGCLSLLFAMDFRLYNPHTGNKWMWRVLFTFLSVTTLYFLLYYSVYSIKKNDWLTR